VQQQVERMAIADNRGYLNRFYADQTAARSGDVVSGGIANFVYGVSAPTSQPAGAPAGQFNDKWFMSNSLAPSQMNISAGERVVIQSQQGLAQRRSGEPQPQMPAQPPPPQVTGQNAGVAGRSPVVVMPKQPPAKGQSVARSKAKGKLEEYKDTLQAQANQPAAAQRGELLSRDATPDGRFAGSSVVATVQPPPMQPPVPAGLASLDVEIPQIGELYRFTSPRGEATITVRAVSRSFTNALKRLAMAAVIAVAVWLIFKVTPRLAESGSRQSTLGLVLMVTGIVCLLTGILPCAAVIPIVAGLVLRLRGRFNRKHPTAATI
jgi:hypothetical protein